MSRPLEGTKVLSRENLATVEIWLRGGLGNQLFQYGFARALSEKTSCEIRIRADLLPAEADMFMGSNRWTEQISTFRHSGTLFAVNHQPPGKTHLLSKMLTVQRIVGDLAPKTLAHLGVIAGDKFLDWRETLAFISKSRRLTLNNYFNDSEPIQDVREVLMHELNDVVNPDPRMKKEASRVSGMMAIHIRLGDHVSKTPGIQQKYKTLIRDAVFKLQELGLEPHFAVFSDQPELALHILEGAGIGSSRTTVVRDIGLRPIETLYILSSCSGLIASPSTFAWWGGFLQPKSTAPIIFKTPWAVDPSHAPSERIFLSDWLQIPVEY